MNKYSNKDMTGWDLSDRTDMDGLTIEGLCLSQEKPDSQVLPENLKGVTFIACNLSNVQIPVGNTVIDCNTTRFEVQNDLRDWVIDEDNEPIKPIGRKYWESQGYSVDPADIPIDFIRREIVLKSDYLKDKDTEEFKSWFLEDPQIINEEVRPLSLLIEKEEWVKIQVSNIFYPFDEMPEVIGMDAALIVISGKCTYVTISGKGVFKGGIGFRPFDNKVEDLKEGGI